ncbi:hypothetical protein NH340_JMT09163 [Sarcoptes scabiei]|nr:hypothetical protein NH340_JMT09163 [Sarcoptes scabiei]
MDHHQYLRFLKSIFVVLVLGINYVHSETDLPPFLLGGAPMDPSNHQPTDHWNHICQGEHETWSKCNGHCQKTCYETDQLRCPKICASGCICEVGYVRQNTDGTGKCVRKEECSKIRHKCGHHQHWDECDAVADCQATCQFPNVRLPCPYLCLAGCVCDEGYVREFKNGTGECISLKHCEERPRCPEHQYFSKHRKNCERTCYDLDGASNRYRHCRSGCVCRRGFVRQNQDQSGPCIRPSQCFRHPRHICPPHQYYTACDAGCDRTCRDPYGERPCTYDYRPGCTCYDGYYRLFSDGSGPCVRWNKCKQECKRPHEKFSKCKAACQPTCRRKHFRCRLCRSGCVCRAGFVRKFHKGPCILEKNCKKFSLEDLRE